MKRALILAAGALVLVAACSSDSKTSTASSSTSSSSSSSSSTAGSSASTASSSSSASSASSGATTGSATLATASNAKVGKTILVDSKGMTVYLYDPDGTNTMSQVPASIKPNWPPVTATDAATVGSGLDASKVAVQTQADGTKQVAYNGHLLYYFIGDKAAGDATGQGLGGVWYVLSADGNKLDTD